jgi:hypothetical protein
MMGGHHLDSSRGAAAAPSPDTDDSSSSSFALFTLEMKQQQLSEAALRDRHMAALLKLKERALVAAARQELAAIEQQLVGAAGSEQEERAALRRKQRSILLRLKEKQKEIERLRETLRMAEWGRQSLMEQQQSILARLQRTGGQQRAAAGSSTNKQEKGTSGRQQLDTTLEDSVQSEEGEREAVAAAGVDLTRRRRPLVSGANGEVGSKPNTTEGRVESGRDETDTYSVAGMASALAGPPALLPMSPQRFTPLRIRHASGGESEIETPTALRDNFGDTTTTASDQSDVEARISALNEQLRTRIRTAARLKKEQERRRMAAHNREQLRGQEAALRKQIEVYDQLISQGLAEETTTTTTAAAATFSKPKIKSPKSSLAAVGGGSAAAAARRERRTTETTSKSSAPTSPDQSVSLSQALGGEFME